MIAHVVLLTPDPSLDAAGRKGLVAALEVACRDIPEIRRVTIGRRRAFGFAYDQLSPVQFEFLAVLEFDTEGDLRAYLAHPAHAELGRRFAASALSALAHDFELVDPGALGALADSS